MFVTNTQSTHLGIDGTINLTPNEENRYVPDTFDLITRIGLLEKNNLVTVNHSEGLTKTGVPGTTVQVRAAEIVNPVKESTIRAASKNNKKDSVKVEDVVKDTVKVDTTKDSGSKDTSTK